MSQVKDEVHSYMTWTPRALRCLRAACHSTVVIPIGSFLRFTAVDPSYESLHGDHGRYVGTIQLSCVGMS